MISYIVLYKYNKQIVQFSITQKLWNALQYLLFLYKNKLQVQRTILWLIPLLDSLVLLLFLVIQWLYL